MSKVFDKIWFAHVIVAQLFWVCLQMGGWDGLVGWSVSPVYDYPTDMLRLDYSQIEVGRHRNWNESSTILLRNDAKKGGLREHKKSQEKLQEHRTHKIEKK
jgi:hypothetical protein